MIQKGTMLLYFKHKKFLSFFNLKYVDYLSVFRKYDKKWMIEMDRFVYNLNGEVSEVIQRQSIHSAATMKERQSHLKSLMENVNSHADSGTWCGFPHHMLVPKYGS